MSLFAFQQNPSAVAHSDHHEDVGDMFLRSETCLSKPIAANLERFDLPDGHTFGLCRELIRLSVLAAARMQDLLAKQLEREWKTHVVLILEKEKL